MDPHPSLLNGPAPANWSAVEFFINAALAIVISFALGAVLVTSFAGVS